MIRKAKIVHAAWLALAAGALSPVAPGWAATTADRQFTLAVVPDTQNYVDFNNQRASGYPFDAAEIFYEQMAYIARNVQSAGGEIAFVTHVGDVWQHPTDGMDPAHRDLGLQSDLDSPAVRAMAPDERTRSVEMAAARRGFGLIDGKVPFSVVPGNHDYDALWAVGPASAPVFHYGGLNNFNEVFGARSKLFRNKPWRVSAYNGGADSATVFSAGGYRFLHLGFEYAPPDDVIAWAESVIRRHRGLPTIVTIHDHLDKRGQRKPYSFMDFKAAHPEHNDSEDLWQKLLSRHPQIFLVLSGHQAGQSRRVDAGADAGKVWQLLADYQDRDQALRNVLGLDAQAKVPRGIGLGDGWMRLLEFDFSGAMPRMRVRTYSTYFKAHAGELPSYAAWYRPKEQPDLSDEAFLAEEEFTIELDDFVQRFGPPGRR
jgi:hypothetical protein